MGRQSAGVDEEVDQRKERMLEMRKPNRSAAGWKEGWMLENRLMG
jgi:hypothetical protein